MSRSVTGLYLSVPSEAVAIKRALEPMEKEAAKERQDSQHEQGRRRRCLSFSVPERDLSGGRPLTNFLSSVEELSEHQLALNFSLFRRTI